MSQVDAIMGAGIGDEGQTALVAELLAGNDEPAHVIRANGSGAMSGQGATLVLAHRFLIDPVQPLDIGDVLVHGDCSFITPLDDFVGQLRYEALGETVHAGRGNALAAALTRLQRLPGSSTTVANFGSFDPRVHEDYVKHVLRDQELRALFEEERASPGLVSAYARLISRDLEQVWTDWFASAEAFFERVKIVDHDELARVLRRERLIFTHPHGLLDREELPSLSCGIADVVALLRYTGAGSRPINARYCASEEDDGLQLRVQEDLELARQNNAIIASSEVVVPKRDEVNASSAEG